MIRQPRLTRAQWDRELNKMSAWMPAVQRLNQADRQIILDYLSGNSAAVTVIKRRQTAIDRVMPNVEFGEGPYKGAKRVKK